MKQYYVMQEMKKKCLKIMYLVFSSKHDVFRMNMRFSYLFLFNRYIIWKKRQYCNINKKCKGVDGGLSLKVISYKQPPKIEKRCLRLAISWKLEIFATFSQRFRISVARVVTIRFCRKPFYIHVNDSQKIKYKRSLH